MTRTELARMIDHTLLAPTASDGDVRALVREAVELGVGAVCVSPTMVRVAAKAITSEGAAAGIAGGSIVVASVVGFPSGAHRLAIKVAEAGTAVADGAAEVDLVADLAAVVAGNADPVAAEVEAVRAAVGPAVTLKVILESAVVLADDGGDRRLAEACRAAADAGADLVKTSTGVHPAGGATTEAVAMMAAAVAGRGSTTVGVKASGGIRSADVAIAMVEAGATRLGASASRAILDGLPADPSGAPRAPARSDPGPGTGTSEEPS
ncbi:MAG: deoxyribose-phosphate aldolase [Microthrixaceae bacterium]